MVGFNEGFGKALGPALRSSAALAERSREFDASQSQNQAQFDASLVQRQNEAAQQAVARQQQQTIDLLNTVAADLRTMASNAATPEEAEQAIQFNIAKFDGADPNRSRLGMLAAGIGATARGRYQSATPCGPLWTDRTTGGRERSRCRRGVCRARIERT